MKEDENMEINKTAELPQMDQMQMAQFLQMAKLLIRLGGISRQEAEITLARIALENELTPVYF